MSPAPYRRAEVPRAPRTQRRKLHLRPDGGLRMVVIADTHSAPHAQAETHIRALAPDAILHAGDIGDLAVLEPFAAIAPLTVVRGNIDDRAPDLPDHVVLAIGSAQRGLALRILLTHIAVRGPRILKPAAALAHEHEAQLIVCGHSHVPFLGRDRGLTVFNAGSVGPRRFHLPIVFGVVEIADGRLTMRHIDCESGEEWRP